MLQILLLDTSNPFSFQNIKIEIKAYDNRLLTHWYEGS